ncbi:MAG: hypothetical protein EXS40_09070 [Opitutaceae bacterium]|nr:hypothetical protein [Opitutaceae bacterium]
MKTLLIVLGVLAALGVAAVISLQLFLGSAVTAGVNHFAPKLTQTSVVLQGASISPLTGSGTLTGLVIGNPKGWGETPLCTLGKVHLNVAPFSLLSDRILINEIVVDAPEINYETKIIASNVADLLKSVDATLGGGNKALTATTKDGKPIKVEVKKFRLTNARVRLGADGAGLTIPMSDMELHDLGTAEGGLTPEQLTSAIVKQVAGNVVAATVKAGGDIGKTGGAAAAEGAKKAVESIKGLFGGGKK